MSSLIYLTLNGRLQGQISKGAGSRDSIGNKYQAGHEDEIFVFAVQHLITRAENVNHHPILFTKPIDKATPLLSQSINNNEELECLFKFYRTSENGGLEHYFAIKLIGASIDNIKGDYPHSVNNNDRLPQEMVSVRYKDILIENILCGTNSYSAWADRVF